MNAIPVLEIKTENTWLAELRIQCDQHGRKVVSDEIGYSTAVISQILNGKYPGNLERVEKAVRGAFMGECVICPVLGEISVNNCMRYHKAKPATHNPTRVRLARTCPNCEHNGG